ncbi:MAG: serine hydroxymethyltransferase [Hyphomicrobiales bacterium]
MSESTRKVYFEFVPVGPQIKVSAIDSLTKVEVSIIAPKSTMRRDMERIALRKLQRALEREGAKS